MLLDRRLTSRLISNKSQRELCSFRGSSHSVNKWNHQRENTETSKEETEPVEFKTRSGRVRKPIEHINITTFATETYLDEKHDYEESQPWRTFQAMAASANPDILYYHEAMKAPDREKFLLAMEEEVRTHSEGNTGRWCRARPYQQTRECCHQYGRCAGSAAWIPRKCTSGRLA